MLKQQLIIRQIDSHLQGLRHLGDVDIPAQGWIHNIRCALKMTLKQLGKRLNITPQSIKDIENRENKGAITLETMEKVGAALNMKFVYAFLPIDGSIDKMVEVKARELATNIVMRTSISMKLENQEVSKERIEREINDLTEDIKRTMPKSLWD